MATEKKKTQKSTVEISKRYAIVSIGDHLFAIPLENVIEVSVLPRYTKVPTVAECILGITNLRGNIVSLIDSHLFFNIQKRPYTEETRVLYLSAKGIQVGFIVDAIVRITEFVTSNILKPVGKEDDVITSLLSGVVSMEKELIRILDIDKVMETKYIKDYQ